MKQFLICVYILAFSNSLFSQEMKTDSIMTKESNYQWISELNSEKSINSKVQLIEKKIFTDSNYKSTKDSKLLKVEVLKDKTITESFKIAYDKTDFECKLIFYLSFNKRKVYELDINKNIKTEEILELIQLNDIDNVTVFTGPDMIHLYGIEKCGIVTIYSSNRKLKRKVKNVL